MLNVWLLFTNLRALKASAVATPSPTAVPRFVMTANDSFGTPNVVGVENLNTQYREDKRLRVHETPFEERRAQ